MLFTHNVKKMKGAAHKNGDFDGTCKWGSILSDYNREIAASVSTIELRLWKLWIVIIFAVKLNRNELQPLNTQISVILHFDPTEKYVFVGHWYTSQNQKLIRRVNTLSSVIYLPRLDINLNKSYFKNM